MKKVDERFEQMNGCILRTAEVKDLKLAVKIVETKPEVVKDIEQLYERKWADMILYNCLWPKRKKRTIEKDGAAAAFADCVDEEKIAEVTARAYIAMRDLKKGFAKAGYKLNEAQIMKVLADLGPQKRMSAVSISEAEYSDMRFVYEMFK